ncbi:hypothetical protein SCATT_01650 [Streptantibioticus cattleyicolor NRRL 8057 = DSM 46488]|uniref:Uncharacterized protein n=1 Tax=Streptantibioticus cattleyicolor (strain ATCC 35852 / DSM 46488 / JCM 4925 / NBRC 14057 / NRRL 8057) TaxID=1003195 RepID=G8X1K7_STREN|nr:hypothetical protein SCATT_01650 [Streptantibioticus cattleyicolor NRRL 8057 = DSM 46488]
MPPEPPVTTATLGRPDPFCDTALFTTAPHPASGIRHPASGRTPGTVGVRAIRPATGSILRRLEVFVQCITGI